MDMTTRANGDEPEDEFDFHRSLVASIVQVCCLTSLARREHQADHRADMLLLADMICAELLAHTHPRLRPTELADVMVTHCENVLMMYGARARR